MPRPLRHLIVANPQPLLPLSSPSCPHGHRTFSGIRLHLTGNLHASNLLHVFQKPIPPNYFHHGLLMLYDATNSLILLVHAKWLLRPDAVQEVLAKDDEIRSALTIADNAATRIRELGGQWISNVLGSKVE